MFLSFSGKNIIYVTASELRHKVQPTFTNTLNTKGEGTITIKVLHND